MSETTMHRPLTDDERVVFAGAKEIISDPERWTTSYYARDVFDHKVDPSDDYAVCFCAIGAAVCVAARKGIPIAVHTFEDLTNPLVKHLYPENCYGFSDVNDDFGREAAIAVLDYALEHGLPYVELH